MCGYPALSSGKPPKAYEMEEHRPQKLTPTLEYEFEGNRDIKWNKDVRYARRIRLRRERAVS